VGGDAHVSRLALVALFVIAAAWRLAYLARLAHTPFADSLDADARIYWDWSEHILRHGLIPPAPFFLAPLYPYLLAALRAVSGGSIAHVLTAQALIGAAAVVLLADATRRVAGTRIALVVGTTLALFQTTTFFDGLILPESLLFFFESLLVWHVARTDWSRAGAKRFAIYGLLVGVLALGRASDAVWIAPALPLAWAASIGMARRLVHVGIALAAFAACALPSTIANLHASGEPIPYTYNLGFNLYVGNNPDANGAYVDVTSGSIPVPLAGTSPTTGGALDGRAFLLASEGKRLGPSESSSYWARKGTAFMRSSPLTALRLAGKKLLLAWNRRDVPQIESIESFARAAGPLGLPIAGSFGFLAILGLAGIAWAARGGTTERWLVGYFTLGSLAMAPFFVTDRYRHHLIPALAVLAGVAIDAIARAARSKSRASLLTSILAIGVATAIVFAPVRAGQSRPNEWAFAVDRAIRLLDRGDAPGAAEEFARAESMLGDVRERSLTPSARTNLAAFYFRYGLALESLGRHDQAIARWEHAVLLNPNDATTLGRLSLIYESEGRTSDAARIRRLLAATPGGNGQSLLNDGWSAAARGDLAGAERLFLEALRASPDLSMAWEGLIRIRIQTGRYDEAAKSLDQARGAGLDPAKADVYECFLAAQRGDLSRARRILERIPSASISSDPFLAPLLDYSRKALGVETRAR
jgi:tetratricopeptide (TPR) repeat protein